MTEENSNLLRLHSLSSVVCDDLASAEEWHELEAILADDEAARSWYLDYCRLHVDLYSAIGEQESMQAIKRKVYSEPIPAPITSVPSLVGNVLCGSVPNPCFSGWPAAYLIATVIFGIGIVIGSSTYVSQPEDTGVNSPVFARGESGARPAGEGTRPAGERIGRITRMFDCEWAKEGLGVRDCGFDEGARGEGRGTGMSRGAERGQWPVARGQKATIHYPPTTNHYPLSTVSLGDVLALKSGLIEITYNTGARVILQGPATYEIDSKNGGFLFVGKLTGKMVAKGARGFAIRTPTATVTDLGTEFGVEVNKEGSTLSHVYSGAVRLETTSSHGKPERESRLLRENESARVEYGDDRDGVKRIKTVESSSEPIHFVRAVPARVTKTLDLVDIVAGGDGFSGRRNRGINPTNGQISPRLPNADEPLDLKGDYRYHPATRLPLVDGVFIPDGSRGPVQVDSAGHMFGGFSKTSNIGYSFIWAGTLSTPETETYSGILGGINYGEAGHGALLLHANKAVTFDLEAIRQASPNRRLLRFVSMAGCSGTSSNKTSDVDRASLWVLVDGKLRFERQWINSGSGATRAVVPLDDSNRFLTLAATDGDDGLSGDQIIFGDPRIELLMVEPDGSQPYGQRKD